jgi:hypothetical protein
MRGLAPAIQIADELYKKRLEAQSKSIFIAILDRSPAKGKISKLAKTKGIAKRKLKKKSDSENESDES